MLLHSIRSSSKEDAVFDETVGHIQDILFGEFEPPVL